PRPAAAAPGRPGLSVRVSAHLPLDRPGRVALDPSLATAVVINAAVDQAIAASHTTIVVPDAGYSLVINSIEPSGEATVRFVALSGDAPFEATADCRSGSLNRREPASAAQAQLINAACQVAYGS
ncbi:MAG: hypothetical protein VKO65_08395, partial [Cyanobacteriota bacterium]|nr:hypothetical protein [Cyanobacteriota bacterium]